MEHMERAKFGEQVFVNKESKTPQVLKFHPYQPQLAVLQKASWRYIEANLNNFSLIGFSLPLLTFLFSHPFFSVYGMLSRVTNSVHTLSATLLK